MIFKGIFFACEGSSKVRKVGRKEGQKEGRLEGRKVRRKVGS